MNNDLLSLYNQELSDIKEASNQFAQKHPRVASNLNLHQNSQSDPLIGHLFESFSFISARIQSQLNNDNDEFTQCLLQRFYPHYLKPMPCASIIEIQTTGEESNRSNITAGSTIACSQNNERLIFNTVYDTTIEPITITHISYEQKHLLDNESNASAKACIKISIKINPEVNLDDFTCNKLRLYINAEMQYSPTLYELILNQFNHLSIETENNQINIPNAQLSPVGLSVNESLIPFQSTNNPTNERLSEYFSFPEKFQFIDINFPNKIHFHENHFCLNIHVNTFKKDIAHQLNHKTLLLNCVPIVNVFKTHAEPIKLNNKEFGHEIKIDPYSSSLTYSIYQIRNVFIIDENNKRIQVLPYFSPRNESNDNTIYWYEQRTHRNPSDKYSNQKVNIYLIDNTGRPVEYDECTLHIELTATNHNLPYYLCINEETLSFWNNNENLNLEIKPLYAFTMPKSLYNTNISKWRLINHLNHDSISLTNSNGKQWLNDLLNLHQDDNSSHINNIIKSIQSISTKTLLKRSNEANLMSFAQGTQITIFINDEFLSPADLYLFFHILSAYWQYTCTINTFVETQIKDIENKTIFTFNSTFGKKGLI
jgi:type VI secretion system protein ImpG